MLALLGIGVNLYEDAGGEPGALVADDAVSVGDTFFVEITVEDLRDEPQGVNGLSLDLTWDAEALEVINDPFQPADRDSPLVTSAFAGFRGGTLDEANGAAMIDDLRGVGPSLSGIGTQGPEPYSLIHFRADAPSQQTLDIAIGDIGAGLVNYLRNLMPDDLQIERPVITVSGGESEDPPVEDSEPNRGWQNSDDPLDVDGNGLRTPRDVLLIINELSANGPHLLPAQGPGEGRWQLDVNGDGGVSRLDALLIFNFLTFGTSPEEALGPAGNPALGGEGEAAAVIDAASAPTPAPRTELPGFFEPPEVSSTKRPLLLPEAVDLALFH